MSSIIKFCNVSFSYKTQERRIDVLNNFNLTINQGEFVVLLGKSGSGKTTILNLIAGFLSPTKGDILMGEQNISRMSEGQKCKFRNGHIGFVFQFFNLINEFRVRDNIALPLMISNSTQGLSEKVESLANEFAITERLNHYPNQLSGGEQQRVAIARALINNPQLILADEPTGNLDNKTSAIIIDYLRKINDTGKTLIVVTHDNDIAKHAHRVIDLSNYL